MKLGEILVQRQIIDKTQLKEALEAQLIFGGHIGTCLMELGYLTEQHLAQVLSDVHGVGSPSPGWFESIPKYVSSAFNDRLVEKFQAVPFRLTDKTLDVAMVDPKDLLAQDELSFASGYKIRAWVAPEARIFQAMERYYDIPRRLRYVTLCKQIDRQTTIEPQATGGKLTQAMREAVRPRATPPPRPAAAPQAQVRPHKVTSVAVLESSPENDPLEALAQRLARVETIEQVMEIALDHATLTLDRCLLFVVRSGQAIPWQAAGIQHDQTRWESLAFAITTEPMFGLTDGEELFRGPVPHQAAYAKFYDALGFDMPQEAILIPAHADDRLVAVFYGDGGVAGRIRGEDEDYVRMVKKTGLALSMVQTRKRILSV